MLVLTGLATLAVSTSARNKPTWRFSVLASIDSVFVEQFGGLSACDSLIRNQLDSVNHIYNDPAVFDGHFEFYLDSLQPFTQNGLIQAHEPHPDQDYHVVYDFDDRTLLTWLYPPDNAVLYRTFSTTVVPFPFTGHGDLVLAHELAHSRGAVDLYGLEVSGLFNEVNGKSFWMPGSIMSDLVTGEWSDHTVRVINRNGDGVLPLGGFRLAVFPSQMGIRVVDRSQTPLAGAAVAVYGHTWYDMALSDKALAAGTTGAQGYYALTGDIYIGSDQSGFCPNQLCLKYSTLLVEVKFDRYREYLWLPFTEPQLHVLRGETGAYVRTVEVPTGDAPAVPEFFTLVQNYPNPFNAHTSVCVSLEQSGHLRLEITNLLGRTEAVLHDAPLPDGTTCFEWDGEASSGLYLCRATAGGVTKAIKMLLVK